MKNQIKAAMLLLLLISVKWGNAQDVSTSTGGIGGMIPSSPTPPDVLRVQNGWYSHLDNGANVGTFGSTDRWQATGRFPITISGSSVNFYGRHTQYNQHGLYSGFNNNTNPVIDWIDYTSPYKFLTFRHGVRNAITGNSTYTDIFKLGYDGSALLGSNASGLFPYTPMFETNTDITGGDFGIGHAINAPNSAFGMYIKSNPDGNYTTNYGVHTGIEVDNELTGIGVNADILGIGEKNFLTGFKTIVNPYNAATAHGLSMLVEGSGEYAYGSETLVGGSFKSEAYGHLARVIGGDYSYGLWATADANGGNLAYGIYTQASNSSNDAAGYFDGDVWAVNYNGISDKKFKRDIQPTNVGLNAILKLKPVDYYFIQDEQHHYTQKLQHGLIAQDVEEILPELVTNAKKPLTEKGKVIGYEEHKGVNYMGLISIQTKAIQELNEQIEALKSEIDKLKAANTFVVNETNLNLEEKKLLDEKAYSLSQNVPNPFNSKTIINYTVPQHTENAMIAVFDLNGRMLLQFNNLKGSSNVTIEGSKLQPGMYLYSLISNGKEVITKKMILTK